MSYIFKSSVGLFVLLIICSLTEIYGQRVYSVYFNQLPTDMQLYARDDNNMAEVPISGIIEIPGWSHMSVITYRNGEKVGYHKSLLNYQGRTSTTFEMKPTIKAEMADYSFEVFACKATDSISLIKRNDVVAGDFYVISGQSNASATIFGNWSSKYARTIARIPDESPAITPADTLWIPAAWSWTYVGAWGLELQKQILEEEGIPTCVINGSLPGKKISEFLIDSDTNPINVNSLYGSLLTRVRKAKPTRIRAFFWVHGEQEALEYIKTYPEQYDQLYKKWVRDYPEVDQFIVLQTNLILLNHENSVPISGSIRDFLRRTKYLYAKTDHFSPIGIAGYDGMHYSRPGYEELGQRLFQFLRPKVYKSGDSDNVRSADIRKVQYTSNLKNEIVLTFDEGQMLKWANDTTIRGEDGQPLTISLKDLFYLDGDETKKHFSAGRVDSNRVILTLKEPFDAKKISYLPSYFIKNLPDPTKLKIGVFNGPYLKNKRGVGAFSFENVSIDHGVILGDEDLIEKLFVNAYPNPVEDFLSIDFEQSRSNTVEVYSLTGKRMFSEVAVYQRYLEIDMKIWPKGIYILTVKTGNGKMVNRKIFKN
ncbi:hypothetical protein DSL64_18330 [Dyadobacter luteus]|uniref:Secretion system C-terminal sorting domain-containing protein n=2 Tax=Dyadobacter luteus TaxID=2259619 RepID=A0A3D8YB64_9BACT|nr:hypothetical protein DSL64_18330 [Dyadobacter luteus]